MPSYEDFLEAKPYFKVFKNNNEARKLFEDLSLDDKIIERMKFISDENSYINKPPYKSALSECYNKIETDYAQKINLNNYSIKRGIGVMIRCIMEEKGYEVIKKENGTNEVDRKSFHNKAKYFRSASCYKKIAK